MTVPPGVQASPWWHLPCLFPCPEAREDAISVVWGRIGVIRNDAEGLHGVQVSGCATALQSGQWREVGMCLGLLYCAGYRAISITWCILESFPL